MQGAVPAISDVTPLKRTNRPVVLKAVLMKNQVFWDTTSCTWVYSCDVLKEHAASILRVQVEYKEIDVLEPEVGTNVCVYMLM
jgi:hypothetical protein